MCKAHLFQVGGDRVIRIEVIQGQHAFDFFADDGKREFLAADGDQRDASALADVHLDSVPRLLLCGLRLAGEELSRPIMLLALKLECRLAG